MGRTKSFNEKAVLIICADIFTAHGYEGTSIDQLVSSTGLLRGSLYSAFGSKRGLFLATLKEAFTNTIQTTTSLDLCLIALLELAPNDSEIRKLVETFLDQAKVETKGQLLGDRLLKRANITSLSNK